MKGIQAKLEAEQGALNSTSAAYMAMVNTCKPAADLHEQVVRLEHKAGIVDSVPRPQGRPYPEREQDPWLPGLLGLVGNVSGYDEAGRVCHQRCA